DSPRVPVREARDDRSRWNVGCRVVAHGRCHVRLGDIEIERDEFSSEPWTHLDLSAVGRSIQAKETGILVCQGAAAPAVGANEEAADRPSADVDLADIAVDSFDEYLVLLRA